MSGPQELEHASAPSLAPASSTEPVGIQPSVKSEPTRSLKMGSPLTPQLTLTPACVLADPTSASMGLAGPVETGTISIHFTLPNAVNLNVLGAFFVIANLLWENAITMRVSDRNGTCLMLLLQHTWANSALLKTRYGYQLA